MPEQGTCERCGYISSQVIFCAFVAIPRPPKKKRKEEQRGQRGSLMVARSLSLIIPQGSILI